MANPYIFDSDSEVSNIVQIIDDYENFDINPGILIMKQRLKDYLVSLRLNILEEGKNIDINQIRILEIKSSVQSKIDELKNFVITK